MRTVVLRAQLFNVVLVDALNVAQSKHHLHARQQGSVVEHVSSAGVTHAERTRGSSCAESCKGLADNVIYTLTANAFAVCIYEESRGRNGFSLVYRMLWPAAF